MDSWLIIIISIPTTILLTPIIRYLLLKPPQKLPPGPPSYPLIGNISFLTKSLPDFERILRSLKSVYGPILTIRVGRRTLIFISDPTLTHKALIQSGPTFSDRPAVQEPGRIVSSDRHSISSAPYGPLWRLLRRNLNSEILHTPRVKSFSGGRRWVLCLLLRRLRSSDGGVVTVVEAFRYAMFCLLLLMCFGERVEEGVVSEIEKVQRRMLLNVTRMNVFVLLPKIGKLVFRKRWREFLEIRGDQERLLGPLINKRRLWKNHKNNQVSTTATCQEEKDQTFLFSYVDSLLDLELPEEGGRKLTESEIVTLCSEFLNAGTDTTSTALQWIMANLVKHQEIQRKLSEEIESVIENDAEEVTEEDLNKLPYLKAVILEGLRRHPPGHFVLPHAVSEEVNFEGYVIPKNATVNFMVADMGWDEKVWEKPMEFRPERFLEGGESVDITGNRGIKMMPFGAGRRICPGLNLAMLHLEYFVANLVRELEWTSADGEEVDLSEKVEFTTVMKKPLRAKVVERRRSKKV